MKKLIISSSLALAMTTVAFAQGTVNWGSTALTPSAITFQTNSTTYSPLFGGGAAQNGAVGAISTSPTGFYFALLYSGFSGSQATVPTSLASLTGNWTQAGLTATNQIGTAGRVTAVLPNTGATVPWANGTTNSIMLAGWSANLGTTYAAALAKLQDPNSIVGNGFFGLSATGYVNPGTANPGVTLFANAAGSQGLPIFSLATPLFLIPVTPVPEPGTMALAALGGASLLLFRRRK